MWCTYSTICWSNPNFFFEYFSCFWKVFCFEKFHKNPKNLQLCFWPLTHQSWAYPKGTHDSLASGMSSRKKYLELFPKSRLLAAHSRVARPSRSIRDSLASGSPSREKDLENFFKIWIQGILVTHSRVSWVVKNVCFSKVGLKIR